MSVMTDDIESIIPTATHNPLEQFVLLAKSAKGAACLELIKQVLEAPGLHVFGELIAMPNISELENGPNAPYFNTLKLFAYGTYKQYFENKEQLLELSPLMIKKLQHLTIDTMAIRSKVIPYKDLLVELDIKNVRDLEDLIIESIYADIIHGKLDQRNSQLEVDYAIGRDIQWNDIGNISATLQEWCDSCERVLSCIEKQIERANTEKAGRTKHKETIEQDAIEDFYFLDYQVSVLASPCVDLFYALYNMISNENRRIRRDEIIHDYHVEFSNTLRNFNFTGKIPTLQDLHTELLRHGEMEVVKCVCFQLFFLLDTAKLSEYMASGDSKSLKTKLFNEPKFKSFIKTELPRLVHLGLL